MLERGAVWIGGVSKVGKLTFFPHIFTVGESLPQPQ